MLLVESESPLELRRATPADVSGIARLRFRWRSIERDEHGMDGSSFEVALGAWIEERRESHLPFLALRGSSPIGMAWLAIVQRVPGPEVFDRRSGDIQSVYVVPEERGTGVGTALLGLVLTSARDLGLTFVSLHHSERSASLYRRLGFSQSSNGLELRLS